MWYSAGQSQHRIQACKKASSIAAVVLVIDGSVGSATHMVFACMSARMYADELVCCQQDVDTCSEGTCGQLCWV